MKQERLQLAAKQKKILAKNYGANLTKKAYTTLGPSSSLEKLGFKRGSTTPGSRNKNRCSSQTEFDAKTPSRNRGKGSEHEEAVVNA